MIVDYKKYSRGTKPNELSNDLLWISEQLPGIVKIKDVTEILREKGFWALYNIPYFHFTQKLCLN